METADTLKIKFGCKTDAELGLLFGRGDKAVSAWRTNGLPSNIVLKARQLMLDRGMSMEQPIVREPPADYNGVDPLMVEAISVMKTWPRSKLARHVAELIAEAEDEAAGK